MTNPWRKSSRSSGNGQCAEVAAWRTSTYSYGAAGVLVRDSKLGEASPVLAVTPAAWEAFTAAVKAS